MARRRKRDDAADVEDETSEEEETTGVDDDTIDEIARTAARRSSRDDSEDDDEESSDDEEDMATDEEVKEWLNTVVSTPEIKTIIRKASREIASKSVDKAVSDVKESLEKDFAAKLDSIQTRLEKGDIDTDEATKQAEKEAEKLATRERERSEADEKADKSRRRKEVELYKREALLEEDKKTLIPAMVIVSEGTSEDDVDEMIEKSRDTYQKVRKQVIRELREQGWKSPKDVQSLQEEIALSSNESSSDDEEEEDDDSSSTSPPTRDRRQTGLTKSRRENLRNRFRYGDKAGSR